MALMEIIEEAPDRLQQDAADFPACLRFNEVPADVLIQARRSLLDLIGVAAAAVSFDSACVARDFAAHHAGPGHHGARMLFDGRRVSVPGAAFAGGAMVDVLDAHETHHLVRGHPGAVLLPALLAITDEMAPCSGAEFLTRFVVGYEMSVRAGVARNVSGRGDKSSGAWNGLGAAALCARALGLGRERSRHALGAAEYYAPAGRLTRCMDYPSMLQDGAASGAAAGVAAALLALHGFTGAPALTVEEEAPELWAHLGEEWLIRGQHINALPVSRWAQAAVEAACEARGTIAGRTLDRIIVETFEDAARLTVSEPETVEAAIYSVPFPVAQMLVHGRVGPEFLTADLKDERVLDMAARVTMTVSPTLSHHFPERRCARLILVFAGGEVMETRVSDARGGPDAPLSDTEILQKFLHLADPVIGGDRAMAIAGQVAGIERAPDMRPLLDLLLAPVQLACSRRGSVRMMGA